ncbi:MAG TPA: SHOCT domain-containing protein [Burkholderiales bacterium]
MARNRHRIAALALAALLAACGGGAEVHHQVNTTTTGQQLIDLQKAYEAGALSKEEYERERNKVLGK